MHNQKSDIDASNHEIPANLKTMTRQQFAQYRAADLVYVNSLNKQELLALIPEIQLTPVVDQFWVLVAANGQPIMVTDQYEALDDWLSEHDADLAILN